MYKVKSLFNLFKKSCGHICPICGSKLKKFLPLDSFYAENAMKYGYKYFGQGETINLDNYLCPCCGATDRERLYAIYLNIDRENMEATKKRKLLHFAPDRALSEKLRADSSFIYRTADLCMDGVNDKVDITNLRIYNDDSFDCFICSHVLEHVVDDKKAILELYRILNFGGWGILMVPIIPKLDHTLEDHTKTTEEERWHYFGQGDHVRLYAKNDYIALLERAGFIVEPLGISFFGENTFCVHGISPSSVLYIVKKTQPVIQE